MRSVVWLVPAAMRQVAATCTHVVAAVDCADVVAVTTVPALSASEKGRVATVVASISIAAVALVQATLLRTQNDSVPLLPMLVSTSSAVSTAEIAVVVLAGKSAARQTSPVETVWAEPTRTPLLLLPELSATSATRPLQAYSSKRYS